MRTQSLSLTLASLTLALSGGVAASAPAAGAHPATASGAVASEVLLPFRPTHPGGVCLRPRQRRVLRLRGLGPRLTRRGCLAGGRSRVPHSNAPAPRPVSPAPSTPSEPANPNQTCTGVDLQPTPSNVAQVRSATFCLINHQRALAGLSALRENSTLDSVAQAKSDDMVARDYFDHTSPDGVTAASRVLNSGYVPNGSSYSIGENIAFGTETLGTPAQIVQAWMQSPGHRENILDPSYRDTGLGVAPAAPPSYSDGQPGGTYTQEFGAHD